MKLKQIKHYISLNGQIKMYKKSISKITFKKLNEFNYFNQEQEVRLVQLIETLLKLQLRMIIQHSLHNEYLSILIKLSLLKNSTQELFNTFTIICQLMDQYNNLIIKYYLTKIYIKYLHLLVIFHVIMDLLVLFHQI
ncbi:unnamed protein product [Paramecium pentaurelia]|uniref:Transmembrane protein n=1 Tax=Paramecium pentaurelia TaxID=43138 RepID=A0A8S1X8N6_9CILI|nr:unnamed protein product [Paramecium pentaurelia]